MVFKKAISSLSISGTLVFVLYTAIAASASAVGVREAASQFKGISTSKWNALNATLEGRLRRGLPLSSACFSKVNGHNTSIDDSECTTVQQSNLNTTFRVSQFGSFMLTQWETCQRTSEQCLLDASNPLNPAPWTDGECQQGSVAPYYFAVKDAYAVQQAYAFSLATGVQLSIKNTGHDYKGRSATPNSLSLWTHHLQGIKYSKSFVPKGCSPSESAHAITVEAGVVWKDVFDFSEKHNITTVGGYHQTVGVSGGWVMGGGHSILSPTYGLGVDRVLEFKLVTPDGHVRVASACENPDLFWALRGGGGGTFGVVLESTHRVEPHTMPLQVASVSFNQTATNVPGFMRILTDNATRWGKESWGGHIGATTLINVTPRLTLDQAKESMKDVVDYALAQNGTAIVETVPSWNAFFVKYAVASQAKIGIEDFIGSRLVPSKLFASPEGRDSVYDVLVGMLPWANPVIIMSTPYLYNYTANSTSVTPAWRDSLWHLNMHAAFNWNSTMEEKTATYQTVANVTQSMRDITPGSGSYFNEGDVYEPNHEQSFWGDNYPRLLSIKNKYDPYGLLDCWQCVGWKGSSNPRYSCYLPEVTP
ncbi:hypothetical protein PLICRDRAFT_171694 [Plicaturopsis crispa FD-325 SS-3]|nr:hypothetical protein PLICRDRAFT_171694 [Plicaturopsis crispa FD-325 SS-3]